MVFSSLVFIWIFLPIIFFGYFLIQDNFKNIFLLIGSLVFYAWGEPKYVCLMISSILINYIIGLFIDKYDDKRKLFLLLGVIVNIGLLGFYKYYNFIIDIVNIFLGKKFDSLEVVLPIGISFFTFQCMSYIVDLYRGTYMAQKNIIHLALYISFFPQLIAGPIV